MRIPSSLPGHVLTVLSGYWAFLDFALAFIPVDIVWKLQLKKSKKLLLSLLLSMGVLYVSLYPIQQLANRTATQMAD